MLLFSLRIALLWTVFGANLENLNLPRWRNTKQEQAILKVIHIFRFHIFCLASTTVLLTCVGIIKVGSHQCDQIWQIPPLWQIFKNLWQYIKGLFRFGESFKLTVAQFVCYWANFHFWKLPNIVNTTWSSCHTGSHQRAFLVINFATHDTYTYYYCSWRVQALAWGL